MAIAHRASASAQRTTSGTTLTITKPSGTVDGDLLVAMICQVDSRTAFSLSGWNEVSGLDANFDSGSEIRVFWKIAASEASNYTWTLNASAHHQGGISAFSGNAAGIDVSAASTHTNVDIVCPSVTTTVVDTMLVFGGAKPDDETIAPPVGATEAWDESDLNLGSSVAYEARAATGATGTRTLDSSGTSEDNGSFTLALSVGAAPAGSPRMIV